MTAATTPAHDAGHHHQNIFKSMKDLDFKDTISHQCGVTMNDSVEARAIAELMGKKDGVTVTYQPALIRIDGEGKLVFKMDEISDYLGREMTAVDLRSEHLDPLWPHGARRRQHRGHVRQHGGHVRVHLASGAANPSGGSSRRSTARRICRHSNLILTPGLRVRGCRGMIQGARGRGPLEHASRRNASRRSSA